jgi:hypothetical protein
MDMTNQEVLQGLTSPNLLPLHQVSLFLYQSYFSSVTSVTGDASTQEILCKNSFDRGDAVQK